MVEFFNYGRTAITKTGGASDEVAPVESYAMKSFRKAVLRKTKV